MSDEPTLRSSGGVEHRRLRESVRGALFGHAREPVRIGRFTVLRRLGRGGMGVVYSAYDDELDRKVAIKLIRHDRDDDAARSRLRREAQAIARLSHPNVVPVFEVGDHAGRIFIAMEFVSGRSLRQWMVTSRAWARVIAVFEQAARGLTAAHEAGLVHRDFKPDNVMLGDDGRVRVLDFGVAAFGDEPSTPSPDVPRQPDGDRLTVTGARLGTVAYMAPEQLRGQAADPRSDQFGFCVALWEALYGSRPFAGQDATALLESIERGPKAAASTSVPPRIRAVVSRGLQPDPADRFASMDALRIALAPKRRRTAGVAAAGAIVAVAGASVSYASTAPDDCGAGRATMRAVWSHERRRVARSRVAERSDGVSLRAWQAVEEALDRHAESWGRAQDKACENDDKAESLEQRLCLERGLAGFSDVVDAVMIGDLGLEDPVARLDDPAGCLDPEVRNLRASTEAQRRAPLPPEAKEGLVTDFEDGARSRFGAGWSISTDRIAGGQSTATMKIDNPGADGSGHALTIQGSVSSSGLPRWSGIMVWPGPNPMAPANLSSKRRIGFWARATPGTYAVMVFAQHRGFEPAMVFLQLDEGWQEHEVRMERFDIETYDVTGIFIGAVDESRSFELRLDDIRLD